MLKKQKIERFNEGGNYRDREPRIVTNLFRKAPRIV